MAPDSRPSKDAFDSSSKSFAVSDKYFRPFNPYLIAEIGVNHGGSMVEAKDMISSAAKAGAHAVKFQSYTASKLAAPDYSPSYWDLKSEPTTSQFELFSRYDMFTLDHFRELGDYAGSLGVDFLSTPFDLDIAEGLAEFVPAFKVASADLTNVPLVSGLLEFDLPMILSTGAASTQEILAAAELMKNYNPPAAFLHCVLNYPTQLKNANILGIRRLQESLPDNFFVGYSDHVPPGLHGEMPALQAAFLLGAVVIEKHFTNDRTKVGNDHYHAADYDSLREFSDWIPEAREMMGEWEPDLFIQETARQNARRRIFTSREIGAGEQLSDENMIALRANEGIEVSEWESVVGKPANQRIPAGKPIRWSNF